MMDNELNSDEVKALYTVKYSTVKVSKQQLGVRSCCTGASSFWIMTTLWCFLFMAIPIGLIIATSQSPKIPRQVIWGMIGLIGLGFILLLVSIYPVFATKINKFPTPPLIKNITNPTKPEIPECKAPKRILVICNPFSGSGQAVDILKSTVVPIWENEFGIKDIIIEFTQYAGHGLEICKTHAFDAIDAVCILGGDGSIHEAINGLYLRSSSQSKAPPLGMLPLGTGNNIMLDLGTWSIEEAARRVGRGDILYIDANKVTVGAASVLSVNTICWGLPGNAGVVAEDFRVLGRHRYIASGLWETLKLSKDNCKLEFDSENGEHFVLEEDLTMVVINQTQYFGDGMRACPGAQINDGLMELCYMGVASRGNLLALLDILPTGSHMYSPLMHFKKVTRVKIDTLGQTGIINVDGEIISHKGVIEIECLRESIPIFAPSNYEPLTLAEAWQTKRTKGREPP